MGPKSKKSMNDPRSSQAFRNRNQPVSSRNWITISLSHDLPRRGSEARLMNLIHDDVPWDWSGNDRYSSPGVVPSTTGTEIVLRRDTEMIVACGVHRPVLRSGAVTSSNESCTTLTQTGRRTFSCIFFIKTSRVCQIRTLPKFWRVLCGCAQNHQTNISALGENKRACGWVPRTRGKN